jgi:hypothetical protein
MLGLSRQRVNQLIQSPDFPAPEAELSAGRIWTREAIERWAATHPVRATAGMADLSTFASFTAASRAVIVRAQEEARSLRHGYIGTEHLLLATLSDAAPGVRPRLAAIGVEREAVRAEIERRCPSGDTALVGHIPFTPRAKDIVTEAASLGSGQVEPHHLALALAREPEGLAAELLRGALGVDDAQLRAEMDRVLLDTEAATLRAPDATDGSLSCSFCGKDRTLVRKLIAGPGVYICDECVELSLHIMGDELAGQAPLDRPHLAARIDELAAELDRLRRDVEGDR